MNVGCDGIYGSNKQFDICGVCGGDDSTCAGCTPPYGMHHRYGYGKRMLGDGVMGSKAKKDECGVCKGPGAPCPGCDGVRGSEKVLDECGICGGSGPPCAGCDGVKGSGKIFDECGVCGGSGPPCAVTFARAWVRFVVHNSNPLATPEIAKTTISQMLSLHFDIDRDFFDVQIEKKTLKRELGVYTVTIVVVNKVAQKTTPKYALFALYL